MSTLRLLCACIALAAAVSPAGAATAPNVVIIVTDDHGWADIGYHTPPGQVPIQTPNLDGFLARGIRLENFYATAVCSVTRSCLLTGRNTLRTGTTNERGLPLAEHTMPESFKAAGYQTFVCGKWHLGGSDKNRHQFLVNGQAVRVIQEGLEYAPNRRGWDSHYGQYSGAIDYYTHHCAEADNPDIPDWWLNGVQQDGSSEHTDSQGHGGYSPTLLADKAIWHIQNRDTARPMLLYLAFNAIHGPVSAPPSYLAKYAAIPSAGRRAIAAAMDCMDASIGRVLGALDTAGIADETIVVFFGDNGGDETKGSLNDPLRGTKGDSYDGGIHTPAAIRWPGVLPANVTSRQLMWVGDLFPTLCAATGVTPRNTKPLDGVNLWPALLAAGNNVTFPRGTPLVTATTKPVALDIFIDPVAGGSKVFKLIRTRFGTVTTNELFNMSDDPYEDNELTGNAAYSGIINTLANAITGIETESQVPYIGPPLIKNQLTQGATITLYAPFTSYKAPVVQWRRNGANIPGGIFTQVTDSEGAPVTGVYAATLTLANVTPADAGTYDVVVTNTVGSTASEPGVVTVGPAPPEVGEVATGPTSPTYLDQVWVRARITTAPGVSLAQARLTYDLGTPVVTPVFRETFAMAPANNWSGGNAINPWTVTAATPSHVRQSTGTSNHTVPVTLGDCETVAGSATVTCADTTGLWSGMSVTGPNLPAAAKVTFVTGTRHFETSAAATGSGSGLVLTAAGVRLTNAATTVGSTTVTCDSTVGLLAGMALSGSGLANNTTVSAVTDAHSFVMSAAPTSAGSGLNLAAAGAAAEFQTGTANSADTMFATTNPIDTSGSSGYVEFWLQTRDLAATNNNAWAFQVSADGGTTWNTRLGEDWNSATISLTQCVLNAAGIPNGSTTVTCASTAGLTAGRAVAGPVAYATAATTAGSATVACANTAALREGMFVQGNGFPNNTRILAIVPNISFTISANATATGTSPVAAVLFPPSATVSAVTCATSFLLGSPAYVNTSSSPVAATATTLNHGFQLYRHDLTGAELGAATKLRFQFTGYSPIAPTRAPRVDVDDIVVATTATPPPVTVAMFDDGAHADGAAGDGVFGAAIPVQPAGTTVRYLVSATDSNGASSASPAIGTYTYTVTSTLVDSTIRNAEFLGIPTDSGVTLNVVATADQLAFVEYGTASGTYTAATPVTAFSDDPAKPWFHNAIEIPLGGLQPDTRYFYRLRHRDPSATEFKTRGERSFRTARPRGAPFVFTVSADPHLDIVTDTELLRRTINNIAADAPDFHIDLGDTFLTDKLADGVEGVPPAFGGGLPPDQPRVNERALLVRGFFEPACHSIPFFHTLGNHEAEYGYLFNAAADKSNNIPAWNLKARKAYIPTPVPTPFYSGNATPKDYPGGSLGLLENHYAWEWGDALFIVLDPFWSTTTNPSQADDAWKWTLGRPQYEWLADVLEGSSARYKFVFIHHLVGGSTTLADGITPSFAARGGVETADMYEWGGRNADGSDGFAANRPGWPVPVHQLLVQHKVNIVFHGHDHLYACQPLDGIVYLECPQPGTPNYTALGSAGDGKYATGVLLPNSGHIRVTVDPGQAVTEYVRAYRASDETALRHNREVSHSFAMPPRVFAPAEIVARDGGSLTLRWNAVPHQACLIQWSPDLVDWQTIGTVTPPATVTNGRFIDSNAGRVGRSRGFYRVVPAP